MSNENLLGAPTEGLGQTVTFASNVRGGGSQLGANGFSPLRAGVAGAQGGQVQFAQGPQAVQDPTMSLLVKAGQDMIAPQIEKAKTEAFLKGMQQVAGGQALADVAKDEPWYMQVFGDSDLIAGARAYTQQTKAQETVMALQDNMEELRKLPGDQFNAHVKKLLDSNMTGDAVTDATLMQSMARVLPGLYSSHAREHVKHLQFETATAQSAMRGSAASLLQRQYQELSGNDVRGADRISADSAFGGTLLQAEGQDDKSYSQTLGKNFVEWAEAGNFHAIRVAKEQGYFDKVPAEMRPRIEDLISKNMANAINSKQAEPLAREWLDLRMAAADGAITTERLLESVDKLNERAKDVLGTSEPFLPRAAVEGTVMSANQVLKQMDREAQREIARNKVLAAQGGPGSQQAGNKAAADEMFSVRAYLERGEHYKIANGINRPSAVVIDNVLTAIVSPVWSNPAAFNPADVRRVMKTFADNISGGAPASTLKDQLGYQIGNALAPEPTATSDDAFLTTLRQFKALSAEDPGAAKALFGKHYNLYHQASLHSGPIGQEMTKPLIELRARMADPNYSPPAPDRVDNKEAAAVTDAVKDAYTSWLGRDKVKDVNSAAVAEVLKPFMATAPGADLKERAKVALASWRMQGGAFMAGLPVKLPANLRADADFIQAIGAGKEVTRDAWEQYSTTAIENRVAALSGAGRQPITNIQVRSDKSLLVSTPTNPMGIRIPLSDMGDELVRIQNAQKTTVTPASVGRMPLK